MECCVAEVRQLPTPGRDRAGGPGSMQQRRHPAVTTSEATTPPVVDAPAPPAPDTVAASVADCAARLADRPALPRRDDGDDPPHGEQPEPPQRHRRHPGAEAAGDARVHRRRVLLRALGLRAHVGVAAGARQGRLLGASTSARRVPVAHVVLAARHPARDLHRERTRHLLRVHRTRPGAGVVAEQLGRVRVQHSPAWSLSCEAFFYAMFPLVIIPLARLDRRRIAAVIVACVRAAGARPVGCVRRRRWARGRRDLLLLPAYRFGEFVIGICLALLIKDGWRPPLPRWSGLAVGGCGARRGGRAQRALRARGARELVAPASRPPRSS